MKLAIVIGSLARGGSERQIVELVRASHPHDAECLVICLGDEGSLAGEVREVGAEVVALGFVGLRSWTSARAVARLFKLLRRERPDAVYGFLFWGYSIGLTVARLAVPTAARIAARRSLPDFDVPRRRVVAPLTRLADAVSDAVIANSSEVASAWTRVNPRIQRKIHVVENGVREAMRNEPSVSSDEDLLVVCVGNLISYKGHATLLAALQWLPENLAWSLVLVGDGPEREKLLKQAHDGHLDEQVRFMGVVEDVESILREADVAVLPSYTEGLPNAVLEAMVQGVPVVATDVGGVRTLLKGGAGLVVPPHDEKALAEALTRMLSDRALRASAGRIGAREARARFGIPQMRDRTLAIIRSCIRESR